MAEIRITCAGFTFWARSSHTLPAPDWFVIKRSIDLSTISVMRKPRIRLAIEASASVRVNLYAGIPAIIAALSIHSLLSPSAASRPAVAIVIFIVSN